MAPSSTSKDLLNLEQKNPTSSSLESTLSFCQKGSSSQTPTPISSSGKLVTSSVPKSQVFGKLKDFLGVMAEANAKLQRDAKENPSMDYDIEALTGNEKDYIEMDLVLGVADLHTPEVVAAAESAMSGSQSGMLPLAAASCSGSDSESSDDDDDDNNSDNDDDNDDDSHSDDKLVLKFKNEERRHPMKLHDALTNRSKDHSHFELVIEKLQRAAQAEQTSERDLESVGISGEAEDRDPETNEEAVRSEG